MIWKRVDDEWVLLTGRCEVARIRKRDAKYLLVVLGSVIRMFDTLVGAKRAGFTSWERREDEYAAALVVTRLDQKTD